MIPTSWQKTSDLTWKGVDDACARILVSMQPDCKTVRGYTVEVSGPLRETREEAIRDVERAMWAFEEAPDREVLAQVLWCAWFSHAIDDGAWEGRPEREKENYREQADTVLRMVPALTTQADSADREALARHLGDTVVAFYAAKGQQFEHPFHGPEDVRQLYRALADAAIRVVPRASISPMEAAATMDAAESHYRLKEALRKLAETEKERDRWQATAKAIDADLTFNVNIRDKMLAAAGYTGTDLEAGVRHVADLKSEVKIAGDRLAVVGRKIAQVEKDRAEDQLEIKIAHETLDTANVPRMAGTLSDRIRRLDERLELQRREKHSARTERDLLRQELQHARAETRVAAVRGDLIADHEARIGALEAINQRKTSALALLSRELAEALGVKKVTS